MFQLMILLLEILLLLVTLSASGTGPFTWYDDSMSTTPIFTGNTFNTGILNASK